jgi:hypothetical protein
VLFVNAAMQALTQQSDGFVLGRMGKPLVTNTEARRRFDALLISVGAGGSGGVVSVPRAKAGLCRSGCAVSGSQPFSPTGARRDARAIVVVHDPDSGSANTSEILEQGLDCRGAARLVAALAADHDLKTFAESEASDSHGAIPFAQCAVANRSQDTGRGGADCCSPVAGFRIGRSAPGATDAIADTAGKAARRRPFVCCPAVRKISANRIR